MLCNQVRLIVALSFGRSKLIHVILDKGVSCPLPDEVVIVERKPHIIEDLIELSQEGYESQSWLLCGPFLHLTEAPQIVLLINLPINSPLLASTW